MPPTHKSRPKPNRSRRNAALLAPWWHTAILIVVLLGASLNGTRGGHPLADHSKLPQYLWTMAWEWTLLGFIWLGIRKRITLRELIGGRWATPEDFLLDIVYAASVLVCALSCWASARSSCISTRPARSRACASSSAF